MAEAIISLGKGKENSSSLTAKLLTASIADKFFSAGALACFIGIGYNGVHLWLMLKGKLPPYQNYMALRESHAILQLFMFFGLFILGFVFQAAGKVIGGSKAASPRILCLPLITITALALFFVPGLNNVARLLLALPFAVAFAYVVAVIKSASKVNWRAATLILLGLLGFSVSAFSSFIFPLSALLAFVASVAMVIFGAGEQFVVNFAGGQRLRCTTGSIIVALMTLLFTLSLALIFLPDLQLNSLITRVWFALLAASAMTYSAHTGLLSLLPRLKIRDDAAVKLAIVFGYLWLVLGATLGVVYGAMAADALLHILALGWGATIVFAVSSQIITSMSGTKYFSPAPTKLALLLWQPVVIDRGLLPLLAPNLSFPWLTSILASLVVTWWALGILMAERRIIRAALNNVSPHLL